MKILLLSPLLILFLIPAYAEVNPVSIIGLETTLEEESEIWFEFDGDEIKTAQLSIPVYESGEWRSEIYDLTNLTYSVYDNTEKYDSVWGEMYGKIFTVTGQISENIFVLFIGEYIDEKTIIINAEIYFHDEENENLFDDANLIELEYLAVVVDSIDDYYSYERV